MERDYYDTQYPDEKPPRRHLNPSIIVALIGVVGMVISSTVTALLTKEAGEIKGRQTAIAEFQPTIAALHTEIAQQVEMYATQVAGLPQSPGINTPVSTVMTGRLTGVLTDRAGNPLSGLWVGIRNGPETVTDVQGIFVLPNSPAGDQIIVVKPRTGGSEFIQNIRIEAEKDTEVNLVYDPAIPQLGLLSITAPTDGSSLLESQGKEHWEIIYGRCDGLAQIYNGYDNFDIWVLIRAIIDDSKLWVQHPQAIIDQTNKTWQASIVMGSATFPPYDGQKWIIIAVAVNRDSGMEHITNTESLNSLPTHIGSNIVTVEMEIQP